MSCRKTHIRGFSLVEVLFAMGISSLVITATASLIAYMQNRQMYMQRETDMNRLMHEAKLMFDDYNNCGANLYAQILPTNGSIQLKSLNYYFIDPNNPTAPFPNNLKRGGSLIIAGQVNDDVMVKSITLQSTGGAVQTNTDGTTLKLANLIVAFDPNYSGVTQNLTIPIEVHEYNTNAIKDCENLQDNGEINAVTMCELIGQQYNPQTNSCQAPQNAQWYLSASPDTAQCPGGFTPSPFVQYNNQRCSCQQPNGWSDPRTSIVTHWQHGGQQNTWAPIYKVNYDNNTGTCNCYYSSDFTSQQISDWGWKAKIQCIPASGP